MVFWLVCFGSFPLLSSLIEQYRQKVWPEKSEDKKDNNQDATGSHKNTDSQVQNTDSEENKETVSRGVSAKQILLRLSVFYVLCWRY